MYAKLHHSRKKLVTTSFFFPPIFHPYFGKIAGTEKSGFVFSRWARKKSWFDCTHFPFQNLRNFLIKFLYGTHNINDIICQQKSVRLQKDPFYYRHRKLKYHSINSVCNTSQCILSVIFYCFNSHDVVKPLFTYL